MGTPMRKISALILTLTIAIFAIGCGTPADDTTNNGPEKGKGSIENKAVESSTTTTAPTSSD